MGIEVVRGINFKKYKSFSSDDYEGIGASSAVNLIIGRNNSGKSSAIDIVEYIFDSEKQKDLVKRMVPNISNANFPLDLKQQIDKLYKSIEQWNQM